ncbi:MAG TPA: DUF4019 domain-containing protein [Parachlamydiaceae bacterium]|nr:DUF4019 domain-containing protein [Parachlamydiaceae bacterium]
MLNSISFFCAFALVISSVFSLSLMAATPTPAPANKSAADPAVTGTKEFPENVLKASSVASQAWLTFVDQNKYAESWDKASTLTKLTVAKDEWVQILEKTRKPLGSMTSRQIMDQRTAIDPDGMPKGKYIVMFYKTVFSHKTAFELVTLYLEEGQWSVLTYQVNAE